MVKNQKELLKPKNDFVFQSLFNQGNEKITKEFISALLNKEINKITINNNKELYREYPDDKLGILDLQVDVNDEEKVDVEVQIVDRANLPERLILYFSKLFAEQIKRGGLYENAKKVILIAIIDFEFDLTKELSNFETQWKLRETKNPQKILTDKIEICIIELKKLKENYQKNKDNKKLQWLMFLDNPNSKEVQEIMKENKEVKDAVVEIHEMSQDEKMRRLAELREKAIMDEQLIKKAGYIQGEAKGIEKGKAEGIAEGIEKGKLEGITKGKIELIQSMIKNGMTVESIAKVCNLSVNEINKLRNI